ncbi:MAG: PLP-dependent aminotransferase family protein [Lachnospiraceae bacterium]|nr:PLP-dependent aminotransferase family protein [Lachnospiraceae bacterium]
MLTYDLSQRGKRTMYEFLYEKMKEDILQGRLAKGEKLPSKRAFAEHLAVSVKTVENTYDQLLLEGYIRSEEKKGYYVNQIERMSGSGPTYASFVTKYKEEEYLADFTANNIRYDRFPFASWAKVMRETLTDYDTTLLKTVPFNGVEALRVQIAEYLFRYRGMQVSPDHIVIGAGTEYLYSRLLQLLGQDAVYAVENPGYRKIAKLYEAGRSRWMHIDIDKEGMDVEALRQSKATVIHVSPEHHYPMGLVMPIGRRQALLSWAAEEKERYIIEDDFDCEFRMEGRPVPSMQSMDRSHRVIYMNTFSKTMVPSLRISYMVLPERLMERYISTMNFYSCTVSGFEQYALASFMEKGYFERHIRRMIHYYKQQRDFIKRLIKASELNKVCQVVETGAGTHFLLRVDTPLSDVEIKWAAKERGILLNCLSEFCFENREKYKGLVIINYSDIQEGRLKKAIVALEEIFCG